VSHQNDGEPAASAPAPRNETCKLYGSRSGRPCQAPGKKSRGNGQPPAPWQRTSRRRRCPICCGAGCLVAGPPDAPTAAICCRVSSPEPIGDRGHLHELTRGPTWPKWRRNLKRLAGPGPAAVTEGSR
jgi:hypothetical protein